MTNHAAIIQSALTATSHTPKHDAAHVVYRDLIMPFIEKSRANLAGARADYEDTKRIITDLVVQYASPRRPSPKALHDDCILAFSEKNGERAARGLPHLETPHRRRHPQIDPSAGRDAHFLKSARRQPTPVAGAFQALADVGSDLSITLTDRMVTGIKPKA